MLRKEIEARLADEEIVALEWALGIPVMKRSAAIEKRIKQIKEQRGLQ